MSAPELTVPESSVSNTGAVYTCPVNMGECNGLIGNGNGADNRLFDTERKCYCLCVCMHVCVC